jgi:hypothetical protein
VASAAPEGVALDEPRWAEDTDVAAVHPQPEEKAVARFLIVASYTPEGMKGVMAKGGRLDGTLSRR